MVISAAAAKYWESFESPSDSDVASSPILNRKASETAKKELSKWLSELSVAVEHECSSILYAKSLLGNESTQSALHTPKSHAVSVAISAPQPSQSMQNLRQAPPKPRRCIVRMTTANGSQEWTQVPPRESREARSRVVSTAYSSSQDLVELCKEKTSTPSQDQVQPYFPAPAVDSPRALRRPTTSQQSSSKQWTPPGFRDRRPTSTIIDTSTGQRLKPSLPSYDNLKIRVERSGSRVVGLRKNPNRQQHLRHTIAVNDDDIEASMGCQKHAVTKSADVTSSPNEASFASTESIDSGQCSGEYYGTNSTGTRQPQERSVDEPRDLLKAKASSEASVFAAVYKNSCLPGYPRMASTMDHILRTASSIYSLLSSPQTLQVARDLHAKTQVFIQLAETSPCGPHIQTEDVDAANAQLATLSNALTHASNFEHAPFVSNNFTAVLRRLVEQVLSLQAKIICRYLSECSSSDRLLAIALEHLIHLVLFGDELCIEAIQAGGLAAVLRTLGAGARGETRRFALRALAVLCGVARGCLQLLAAGGLELVLAELHAAESAAAAVEAAGVLTQLTNPQHSFVQLSDVGAIVRRLLGLIDTCEAAESLLLCSAALANTSLQDQEAIDFFAEHNAVARLIAAYNRPSCSTIFVQEQLATILSRMAARRYEECLVAQGAVPVLLEMLTVTDSIHGDYCRRIRYKAAVCIGTLAATPIGLKALYTNQAYAILCTVLQIENAAANPLGMICANIKGKLEGKFEFESTV